MIYATRIKMRSGCYSSYNLLEIDEIYLKGNGIEGYFSKEAVHNLVKTYPGTIEVALSPYPKVVAAESIYGEKYVRSQANSTTLDNLLQLPRE